MRVPYATKWQKEADALSKIALGCGLDAAVKWGKPCFTHDGKNVAIVIPLKGTCAFSFIKGALLADPKRILQKIGEHSQSARWIKFTSVKEIVAVQSTLRSYLREAIALEKAGKKVARKQPADYKVPEELQAVLDAKPKLKAAFDALSPGRRRSYFLHVAGAKQTATRAARVERCVPGIMAGLGFNERAKR